MRLDNERGKAAEAKVPPRWIQVPTWPDADVVRGLRWVDASKQQPPEWWEPVPLGPLPPRRRFEPALVKLWPCSRPSFPRLCPSSPSPSSCPSAYLSHINITNEARHQGRRSWTLTRSSPSLARRNKRKTNNHCETNTKAAKTWPTKTPTTTTPPAQTTTTPPPPTTTTAPPPTATTHPPRLLTVLASATEGLRTRLLETTRLSGQVRRRYVLLPSRTTMAAPAPPRRRSRNAVPRLPRTMAARVPAACRERETSATFFAPFMSRPRSKPRLAPTNAWRCSSRTTAISSESEFRTPCHRWRGAVAGRRQPSTRS